MASWMTGLLGRKHKNPVNDLSVVNVFSDLELRVDLKERLLPCGHSAYWVSLHYYSSEQHDWVDVGILHESDLERMLNLLQEANAYLKEL